MCGRYAFDDIKEIYEARALLERAAQTIGEDALLQAKRGEVFPTEYALVVRQEKDGGRPDVMAWGYPMRQFARPLINARSETLAEKPMFRSSLHTKRCIIACTGFFEWQKADGRKRKMRIHLKGHRFFYLAGLYRAFSIDGIAEDRFVIVTAPANEEMRKVHHRMPLIVADDAADLWLRPTADLDTQIGALTERCGALTITAVQ